MGYFVFMVSLLILVMILKILTFPIRIIWKFIINSIVGGILLYVLSKIGIFMKITWWSILLTGILGIPGLIISIILSIFI